MLIRLFSEGHRYRESRILDDGFVDWKTKELIGGRKYPGLILPLEFDREFHDLEYLQSGRPQSAKLVARKDERGQYGFHVHIAFEFTPEPIQATSILGIDRGAAKIGAATIIDHECNVVATGIDAEGQAFSEEMARLRARIAQHQKKGHQSGRILRLRGRKADNLIGEYANRIVAVAAQHRSQVALEKIDSRSMARFLTQSQFAKLHRALSYKLERVGLPVPTEVPAAFTSQTCCACGHVAKENRPKRDEQGKAVQDRFLCVRCGYAANADDNASWVIALRALHQQLNGGRFQNTLGENVNGFFLPTDTMTFGFPSPIKVFGISFNTFDTSTTGGYTATDNIGDVILSLYDPFPGQVTGQFVGFSSTVGFTTVTLAAPGGFSYTLDDLAYGGSTTIPEPGSLILFGSAILGLGGVTRRKINL